MAKDINQKEIHQRIIDILRNSEMTVRRFAIKCDIDPSAFDKKTKGKQVWTINDVNKISQNIGVRKSWLLNGDGQMMKAPDEALDQIPAMPTRTYDVHTGVPYYDVCFELGFELMENDQTTTPSYFIDFKPFNKADCWCTSKGNSMHPTISNGDAVALKRIYDFSMLINNEIYGLVAKNGLRTIKRLIDQGDTFLLKADNPDYPEQVIKKEDVMYIYKVVGSMKMF